MTIVATLKWLRHGARTQSPASWISQKMKSKVAALAFIHIRYTYTGHLRIHDPLSFLPSTSVPVRRSPTTVFKVHCHALRVTCTGERL